MNTLVFGASAGVGRALCRALAARGHNLLIISRDARDLEAESAHCRILYGVRVDWLAIDASEPTAVFAALHKYLAENDRRFRNLMFPIGASADDDNVCASPVVIEGIVHTNLTSIMIAVSALLPRMESEGDRNIVGFGSIAAIRGRQSNVAYAAAKRGLESYFESLRHSAVSTGIRVKLYRLGYIATQQSFGKRMVFPAIEPATVARRVIADLDHDVGMRHLPRFWSVIGLLIKCLPWRIFRQLNY